MLALALSSFATASKAPGAKNPTEQISSEFIRKLSLFRTIRANCRRHFIPNPTAGPSKTKQAFLSETLDHDPKRINKYFILLTQS